MTVSSTLDGYAGHYGTWQSAIHGFAHQKELTKVRRQLFPQPLRRISPKLPKRFSPMLFNVNHVMTFVVFS